MLRQLIGSHRRLLPRAPPARSEWPDLVYDLPELQYPDRLNCATALLDATIDRHGGNRPCLLAPGRQPWSYDDLRAPRTASPTC